MGRLSRNQHGYTLIELLLYIGILGSILLSIVYFFGAVVDTRIKNQTISEVDQQGAFLMDKITQTIRNATSISSPGVGSSGNSLSLVVPTGSQSPSLFDVSGHNILGLNVDGGTTDTNDADVMDLTEFTASATGVVSTLYALPQSAIGSSPNNLAQLAIYSGTSSGPTTLLASSPSVALTGAVWNAFPIPTVSVTSGQIYWIGYNTNAANTVTNCLRYDGTTGTVQYASQTYGTWPSTYPSASSTTVTGTTYSTYADILPSSGATEIKQGTGSAVPLTSSLVQMTNLSFTNLTRSGTNGSVRVTFTLQRLNPNNDIRYNYRQTFTSTAEVSY